MNTSKFFFYFFILFLFGVLLASVGIGVRETFFISLILFLTGLFIFIYSGDKKFLFISFLLLSIFVGNFYYYVLDDFYFGNISINFGKIETISGTVSSAVTGDATNKSFNIKDDNGEIISVKVRDYSNIEYGDYVELKGKVNEVSNKYHYFKSKKIVGRMLYPDVVTIKKSDKFSLKKELYLFRDKFSGVFNKYFHTEEASLMSGILLGKDSAGFSKDFTDRMKNSGTTHIVALSGYNVLVLVNIIFLFFSFFISRKYGIFIAIISVFLFVIMTGAEASVVRAAIMWLIAISAEIFYRVYNFIRSAVFTAFVMVLLNPFVLVFDVGFILSFAALFGIMYVSRLLPKIRSSGGFKFVSDVFYETLSAQVMVFPILIIAFGKVSAVSLLSNVLILPFIPLLMGAGFVIGIAGMILPIISGVLSMFIYPFVSYVVWVINFFGSMPIIKISFGWWFAFIYYILIFAVIIKLKDRYYVREYIA